MYYSTKVYYTSCHLFDLGKLISLADLYLIYTYNNLYLNVYHINDLCNKYIHADIHQTAHYNKIFTDSQM